MSFINFSNHSSMYWNEKQKSAANEWGPIIDVPFPSVKADASKQEISQLAEQAVSEILKHNPKAVMCQGEFTLSYTVICLLKKKGIKVVSACSDRVTTEEHLDDGTMVKHAQFNFVKFREYE